MLSVTKDVYGVATGSTSLDSSGAQPIVDGIVANLNGLLPLGLAVMGIMIAIGLIARVIYKFF